MRGSPCASASAASERRSIPTCAGQTVRRKMRVNAGWVYPQRVRGRLGRISGRAAEHRSIPTCAGQTFMAIEACTLSEVYPHVCGADSATCRKSVISLGLSPRVRGRPKNSFPMRFRLRSIPTCAGQTRRWSFTRITRPVYPHVCGADEKIKRRMMCRFGLSPRVRGRPIGRGVSVVTGGSIPTCAGQTCLFSFTKSA